MHKKSNNEKKTVFYRSILYHTTLYFLYLTTMVGARQPADVLGIYGFACLIHAVTIGEKIYLYLQISIEYMQLIFLDMAIPTSLAQGVLLQIPFIILKTGPIKCLHFALK